MVSYYFCVQTVHTDCFTVAILADLCYTIWKLFGLLVYYCRHTCFSRVFFGYSAVSCFSYFCPWIWAVFCVVYVIARWPAGTSMTCACYAGPVQGNNRATFARFMRVTAGMPWHKRYVRRNHGHVRGTSRTCPWYSPSLLVTVSR